MMVVTLTAVLRRIRVLTGKGNLTGLVRRQIAPISAQTMASQGRPVRCRFGMVAVRHEWTPQDANLPLGRTVPSMGAYLP